MSNTTDKMLDRYVYLNIDNPLEPQDECQQAGITIHVALADEGVVIDAWQEDVCVASTYKLYSEIGVEVKGVEDDGSTYSQQMQKELEPIQDGDENVETVG